MYPDARFFEAARMAVRLLNAPFVLAAKLYRFIGKLIGAWILMTRDSLPCTGCGEEVSLVGRWECGWCNYVFDGFAFSRCKVCGAVPPYLKCQNCGCGIMNPMFFQ